MCFGCSSKNSHAMAVVFSHLLCSTSFRVTENNNHKIQQSSQLLLWCIYTDCLRDRDRDRDLNEEEWGFKKNLSHCTWTGTGTWAGIGRMGYVPIFQILKLFPVVCFNDISMAFRCPVLAPDTASVNGFCTILVPLPVTVPIPETASVNTPLHPLRMYF